MRGAAMTTTVEPMATRRLVQRGALDWLLAPAPARRLNLVRTLTVLCGLVWIGVRADHWRFRFGGGLDWLDCDRLSRLVAHDNLRKRLLGDPFAPLARFVVGHPLLLRVGVWLTVLVELGAPLVVLGRRWRAAWIGSAWVFHITVLLTMAVLFPYPLFGIAFASMLPVERLRRQRSRASTRRP